MAYIRKFKTSSGATAVQVIYKKGRKVEKTVHIGSASSEAGLKKLLEKAQDVMNEGRVSLFDLSEYGEGN